ncbi:YhcH/YjgK/YiaL family protein [Succinivibrio sp.]|jgi:YhcH/YjgK/YiaL family protein|uniref:YhcH/YjgK/YiaL family protein n=1 Tax=Succinivibrio sp. TaxID=2053619 RepID=UPI0025EEBD35|nr:YhcH/YjgK/YiaL family protein [uncultured Succinivibrio sp.]
MLATSIDLVSKYDYLSEKFKAAYKWLAEHDVKNMEDGKYIVMDGVFAMVQRYETIDFSEARFESHKEYFDIQYIADGKESFGMALVKDCKLNESVPDNDVYFYDTPDFFTQVNLKAGDLIVVPPEEVHQPRACYNNEKMTVVKVVVKVKI